MDLEWKQYEKHIELYKFYIESVIKINAFHYAITGAITSYYFANSNDPDIKWALLLPAFLSLFLAILFGYGAERNLVSRKDVYALRDKLRLEVAPELLILTLLLGIFCIAHLLTGAGLAYLVWKGSS